MISQPKLSFCTVLALHNFAKIIWRIGILHKAEYHLIFWNDVDDIIIIVFDVEEVQKKTEFSDGTTTGDFRRTYRMNWEACRSAHEASLQPTEYRAQILMVAVYKLDLNWRQIFIFPHSDSVDYE